MDGIYSTNLPLVAALDEVVGNVAIDGIQRSARQSMADHAEQIAGAGPIADALAAEATARANADAALDGRVTDVEGTVGGLPGQIDDLADRVDEVEALATSGILWTDQRVEARSTANVDLSTGLINGQTLNGVTVQTGLFYFIGSQTLPAQNGLYPGVAAGASTRATFADTAAEIAHIGFVLQGGTVGTGERWTLPMAAADITLGTTPLLFAETGIEPGYAAEVEAARGGEATLSDRLDLLSNMPSEYGVSIYKSDGIAIGGYYAERSASAASTQEQLYAEILAADVGAAVEFYVSVNGAVTYGPVMVVFGTPISLSGLSIMVAAGDQISFVILDMSGNVTDFFAKIYGDIA